MASSRRRWKGAPRPSALLRGNFLGGGPGAHPPPSTGKPTPTTLTRFAPTTTTTTDARCCLRPTQAGLIAGRCAFLEVVSDTDTTSVCDLTVLTYGDIGTATVNGVLRSAANSSSYISITGGTQAYRSASGQVKVAASADLSYASWSVSLDKTPSCPPGTGTTW